MCARCELVNLDTFPAFPLCEACGARLPSLRRFGWRRPLRYPVLPLVWAIILGAGAAMLALLSVNLARDTRDRERGTLILSGQSVPDPRDGRAQIWTLTLSPTDAGDEEPLRSLRLRLSRKDERRWGLSILSPRPTSTQTLGSGRYFNWFTVPRRATLRLRLLAPDGPQAGSLRLWWTAEGFEGLPLQVHPGDVALVEKTARTVHTEAFTGKP